MSTKGALGVDADCALRSAPAWSGSIGAALSSSGFLDFAVCSYYNKIFHKREICYLGFGDVMQLSTQIYHIEDSVSSVNGRYPAECANKRYCY